MLTQLHLQNIKAIGEATSVKLAPITLVYGPNSAGKSSLIQSLLVLAQSIGDRARLYGQDLLFRGPLVDLGSFHAAVHRHETDRLIAIGVDVSARERELHSRPQAASSQSSNQIRLGVRFEFGLLEGNEQTPGEVSVLGAEYRLSSDDDESDDVPRSIWGHGYRLAFKRSPLSNNRSIEDLSLEEDREEQKSGMQLMANHEAETLDALLYLQDRPTLKAHRRILARFPGRNTRVDLTRTPNEKFTQGVLSALSDNELHFAGLGRPLLYREEFNLAGPAARAHQLLEAAIMVVSEPVIDHLRSIAYLGPLRKAPERFYVAEAGATDSVGTRGENVVPILAGQAVRRNSRRMTERINGWMDRLDIPYSLAIRHIRDNVAGHLYVLELTDKFRGIPVSPSDVGFGMSQLLPILVEGLLQSPSIYSKTICVEQPEIHLHPKLQGDVADFFIATATDVRPSSPSVRSRSVQWIVETHSEAILSRIQRRIREGSLAASAVSVLYAQPSTDGGTRFLQMELDEDGDFISEWPGGFFEEALKDRLASRD